MKSYRTLLHLGGIAAVSYGGLELVSVIIQFIGLKWSMVQVGVTSPDEVLEIYQNGGFGMALFVKLISFIFLVPALAGLFAYLSNQSNGLARIGFYYGLLAYIIWVMTTFLQAGLVHSLAFQSETASFAMKNDVFHINRIIQFLVVPNVVPYFLFLLCWGWTFKKLEETRHWLVGIFFMSTAGLLVLLQLFKFLEYQTTSTIFFMLAVITEAIGFMIVGTVIFNKANEQLTEAAY